MKNSGKRFEEDFKKSVPNYCLLQRLNDSPQAFKQSNLTRFTPKNPCDFFMYNSRTHILYALELKTTSSKSMSFEDIHSDKEQNKMIHKHQICGLLNFVQYDGVVAGFIFNFRDEVHEMERTYFQDINSFQKMCQQIKKQSFNEMDLILNNAVKISGTKKRTRYTWDVDGFLKNMNE